MLFIRSTLFMMAISVLSLIWCPLLYLAAPFPFVIRKHLFRTWSRGVILFARMFCGIKHHVTGLAHLPNEPVVFFSKHQSAWETLALVSILPPNCFVCKQSLLNIPVFGWGMRVGKHIPIDRSAGMKAFKKIISLGKARLAEGLSIVIFPEGTRTLPGEHPKFHKTGAALAKATGAKLMPIALNSGYYWPKNRWVKHPGTIEVVIGEPIDTSKLDVTELNNQAYEWIKVNTKKLER